MSKLLINDSNKLLVGTNGKAYAVRNLDVLKGSSSPVDFTAAAGKILRLIRYGKCEQASTPTPSAPVDIVCNNGAIKFSPNMANVNEQTARVGYYINSQGAVLADIYNWFYQEYIRVKPNTTYTLSMSQPVYYITISEYSTAEDSGFVIRNAGRTGGNTSLTITTGANTNFIRFGSNINRVVVTMEMVLGINWMLNEGSTAIPYAPYAEGGIYEDGTPEVLTVGGQNLIDLTAVTNGYYYTETGDYTSLAPARLSDYIPVEAGKPVYINCVSNAATGYTSNFRINLFNESKQWQSQHVIAVPSGTSKSETITPEQDGFIRLSANWSGNAKADWSLTSIAYVQAASVANLLQVGDYKDEAELIHGLLTHKIGIKVFDGTEAWRVSSSGAMITTINGVAIGATNTPINTHFALETSPTSIAVGKQRFGANNTVIYSKNYYMKHTTITTVADFKSWLASQYAAGTPVIVLYPLATETTESVAPQPLNTVAGQNTLIDTANVSDPEYNLIYKI